MSTNDYQGNSFSPDTNPTGTPYTAGQAQQPKIPTLTLPQYAPVQPASTVPAPALAPAPQVQAPQFQTQPAMQQQMTRPSVQTGYALPPLAPQSPVSQANVPRYQPSVMGTAASVPVKQKKEKKKGSGKKIAAVAVAFCLIGAAAGAGATALFAKNYLDSVRSDAVSAAKKAVRKDLANSDSGNNGTSTILQGKRDYDALNVDHIDTSEKHTASEVYAANVNSTVGITTSVDYNYYGYKTSAAASGSGFILTSDGYIVTNYHVVDGASSIKVTTFDGRAFDALLVGFDEKNDLAVLKIDGKDLTPVILGDSDHLNVGDDVLAIGNPLGELTFSLTSGCVSALNRAVTINNTSMNLIQTDCAINAGNSGGALFNLYGEVIGITNAKYSNNGNTSEASIESIGFAIPINSVKDIIDNIIEEGFVTKPYIGVYCQMVPQNMRRYGLPDGISIEEVIAGGPAEKAGMQNDDIITAIDGKEVTSTDDLKEAIDKAGVGGKLKFTIYRQGDEIEITVTVEEQKVAADHTGTSG